jgi:RNA polymerase sigma factor (sigma-70 family)
MMQGNCSKRTRMPACEEPQPVYHSSFESPDADRIYGPATDPVQGTTDYMHEEATRDTARRMHYAAYRRHTATTDGEMREWRLRYYALRDAIVLGNRKLIYRTVRRWSGLAHRSDDLIGECHIVLIRTVRSYNPWLGIRFSTYACTCLFRALGRLANRWNGTVLSQSVPLEVVGESAEPGEPVREDYSNEDLRRLGKLLREDHPLLSPREKAVLARRFWLGHGAAGPQTLAEVGHDLGISKERVRQVQEEAIVKLRNALGAWGEPQRAWAAG